MSNSMVWKLVRHFNEGCENVNDDPWSGQPSVVNEYLVHTLEEKIQGTDDSSFCHFPCIFHKFHGNFFVKLCLINFIFEAVFTLGAEDA
jgi:hypothetical protein